MSQISHAFWCSITKRNTSNSSTQNSIFVHLLESHAATKLGVMLTWLHPRFNAFYPSSPFTTSSWQRVVNKIPVLPTATYETLRSNGSARKHCGTNSWRRMIAQFPAAPPSEHCVAPVSNGQRMWRDNFQNGLEFANSTLYASLHFFFISIVIISTCGISPFDCSVHNAFTNLAHPFHTTQSE